MLLNDEMEELVKGTDADISVFRELMDEVNDLAERTKTAEKPQSRDFFKENDIVMFVKNEPGDLRGSIGFVTSTWVKDSLPSHIFVRYFVGEYKRADIPLVTHIENIRWIGSLDRFGISWKDIK